MNRTSQNHQALVVIGDCIKEISRVYGADAAAHLSQNLRGLDRRSRITLGDVERYLPRIAYLKWMCFDVVKQ